MIAFGQSAWVTDVLGAIESLVRAGAALPREYVFAYLGEPDDLLAHPPGDKFVAVGVESLPPIDGLVAGGGSAQTAFDGRFRVDVFCRLGSDQQFRDARLLRDASNGMGRLVKSVIAAVQVQPVPDPTGATSVLIEPMRLGGAVVFNPRKPATGWAWARVPVSAKFRTDFSGNGGL
ncbi:hypothetical protein [Fimbriiglobus ruber]|uniref:Phage protein n=1 Tax=Fimbriiglobus ruber TaxID=1908690 RepID=A0A225E4L8_9BACT|nr:hypothetical protein [Fimbriiglobus ruber]OWK45748.1 hypothetical protein FRUB_02079 [Fimbriiglobus ruber]